MIIAIVFLDTESGRQPGSVIVIGYKELMSCLFSFLVPFHYIRT